MKKHLAVGIVAGLLTIIVLLGAGSSVVKPLGSVALSNEYNSTTTRSTSASASAAYVACTSGATLGSIVVTQPAGTGWVQVWDATSTATSSYTLNTSTTYGKPIAKVLAASDVVGTLTYDLNTFQGLALETSTGFDGEYQVTFRCK